MQSSHGTRSTRRLYAGTALHCIEAQLESHVCCIFNLRATSADLQGLQPPLPQWPAPWQLGTCLCHSLEQGCGQQQTSLHHKGVFYCSSSASCHTDEPAARQISSQEATGRRAAAEGDPLPICLPDLSARADPPALPPLDLCSSRAE